MNMLGNIVKDW